MPKKTYTADSRIGYRFMSRQHNSDSWRVWPSNWFGDQFEILSSMELERLEAALLPFGIIVEEQFGD